LSATQRKITRNVANLIPTAAKKRTGERFGEQGCIEQEKKGNTTCAWTNGPSQARRDGSSERRGTIKDKERAYPRSKRKLALIAGREKGEWAGPGSFQTHVVMHRREGKNARSEKILAHLNLEEEEKKNQLGRNYIYTNLRGSMKRGNARIGKLFAVAMRQRKRLAKAYLSDERKKRGVSASWGR